MITVILGVEGEYGRRLARYLENHLDRGVRLRHFTKADQWDTGMSAEDIIVMSHTFFYELSEAESGLLADRVASFISFRGILRLSGAPACLSGAAV